MTHEAILAGCKASHRRLLATIKDLDDRAAREPSRLPSWSVGHVLTHISRNADSHTRILEGALAGEHREQYIGRGEGRAADIEGGAGRRASELVEDVATSANRLERAWREMTDEAWNGHGMSGGRPWPCRELPLFRWREVEVHHVDLSLGYEPASWPAEYVSVELPRAVASLPERLDSSEQRNHFLAWLLGRADQPAALELAPWQSRSEHYTRRPL